jgi:hypothetical protein
MRRLDLDLTAALRVHNRSRPGDRLSREAALRHVGSALEADGQRLVAKPYDRQLRVMAIPTPTGHAYVEVRDSRTASRIGEYQNAVKLYRTTGDESALRRFRGKGFRSGKQFYPFVTDPATLRRVLLADPLRYDSIYEQFGTR